MRNLSGRIFEHFSTSLFAGEKIDSIKSVIREDLKENFKNEKEEINFEKNDEERKKQTFGEEINSEDVKEIEEIENTPNPNVPEKLNASTNVKYVYFEIFTEKLLSMVLGKFFLFWMRLIGTAPTP